MKTVSNALKAHFGQSTTTLAILWTVTLVNGTVMGFTSFDQNLNFNSILYQASSGFLPSANETGSTMAVDNLEVTGFLDSAVIKEPDIRNGVYDYALVQQEIVNWADLTMGSVLLRKGIIGNITMKNGIFIAEVRGLTQYLSTMLGEMYGPLCRAELFSNPSNQVDPGTHYFCNVKESDYVQNGSVSSTPGTASTIVPSAGLLQVGSSTPSAPAPANWFNDGQMTFTSGPNNGFSFEVKTWDGTTLGLFLPLPYTPLAGDTFSIEPGCDKTPTATGCFKFAGYNSAQVKVAATNILNFRGEPFIPGTDLTLSYPDAK